MCSRHYLARLQKHKMVQPRSHGSLRVGENNGNEVENGEEEMKETTQGAL